MQTRTDRGDRRDETTRKQRHILASQPPVKTRVSVAWTPSSDLAVPMDRWSEIELVSERESSETKWTCQQRSDASWLDQIAAARCSEVVLTARSGDVPAKHLVLELAELLTFKLAATQPLIRVRFLPTAVPREFRKTG